MMPADSCITPSPDLHGSVERTMGVEERNRPTSAEGVGLDVHVSTRSRQLLH